MRELLLDLVPWGLDVVVSLQATFGDALDPLFRAVTLLGDVSIYLAFLPLALWRGDTPRGMRLALLLLFSVYVNLLIKDALAIPRPFIASPAVQAKAIVTGYAFPSGHAQGVTTLWLGLAVIHGRRWPVVLGALLIPAVSFSRVYLGVHYPQDAVGGVLIGVAVVAAYRLVALPLGRRWHRRPIALRIATCVLVPLAMTALTPDPYAHALAGVILGLALGRTIEAARMRARPTPGVGALALRVIAGSAVAGLVYVIVVLAVGIGTPLWAFGTGWAGGAAPPALVTAGSYALVGLAISLLAPWVFVRLGLSVATRAGED